MNEMKRMTTASDASGFRFDPYPSRLREPPRQPWLPRLEPPIEGAAEGPLQPSQLEAFERKGFLFKPDFLTPEEVQTLARELERSEEHTSELQSRGHLVCRLLLEKNS